MGKAETGKDGSQFTADKWVQDGQPSKTAQERKADEEQRHYDIARVLTTSLLPAHCELDIAHVAVGRSYLAQKSIQSTRLTLSVLQRTSKKHSVLLLVSLDPRHRSATT